MKKIETDFLSRLLYVIVIGGIIILTAMLITLPWSVDIVLRQTLIYHMVPRYKILVLLYITGVPAWLILWMTRQLAKNIIERNPFSKSSSQSLKIISLCALIIFICYGFTNFFIVASLGILVITIAAFGVGLIAAILYRLVEVAIEIKEENELTI